MDFRVYLRWTCSWYNLSNLPIMKRLICFFTGHKCEYFRTRIPKDSKPDLLTNGKQCTRCKAFRKVKILEYLKNRK